MAKKKADDDTKEKKRRGPPPMEPIEHGVEAVAKKMELTPFTVRGKLREAGIEKDGRRYDFKTAKGVDEVVKKLKSMKPEKEDKPSKKSTTKKKAAPRKKKKTEDE